MGDAHNAAGESAPSNVENQKNRSALLEWLRSKMAEILIAILIAVVSGWFGSWLTSSNPHLKVTVPEMGRFEGEKSNLRILSAIIVNDGSKEAEELECWIELPEAKIQEVSVLPETLQAEKVQKKDSQVLIRLKRLNPNQYIQISGLAVNTGKPDKPFKVEAWAKGVVGENQPIRPSTSIAQILNFIPLALAIGLAIGFYTNERMHKDIEKLKEEGRNQRAKFENESLEKYANRVDEIINEIQKMDIHSPTYRDLVNTQFNALKRLMDIYFPK
jgi:hypothetical protein